MPEVYDDDKFWSITLPVLLIILLGVRKNHGAFVYFFFLLLLPDGRMEVRIGAGPHVDRS